MHVVSSRFWSTRDGGGTGSFMNRLLSGCGEPWALLGRPTVGPFAIPARDVLQAPVQVRLAAFFDPCHQLLQHLTANPPPSTWLVGEKPTSVSRQSEWPHLPWSCLVQQPGSFPVSPCLQLSRVLPPASLCRVTETWGGWQPLRTAPAVTFACVPGSLAGRGVGAVSLGTASGEEGR